MSYKDRTTTAKKASQWRVLMPLVEALFAEFRELSKKKAEAVLSQNKVNVVNRLLNKCRELLCDEPSLEFLDVFDDEQLPQNSDVVLALSQYAAALKQFRSTYYRWVGVRHVWTLEGGGEMDEDDGEEEDEHQE
jgi:hypothetical protein